METHVQDIKNLSIKSIVWLILSDEEGNIGEIESNLLQNIKLGQSIFVVKQKDGTRYRVSITMEEID